MAQPQALLLGQLWAVPVRAIKPRALCWPSCHKVSQIRIFLLPFSAFITKGSHTKGSPPPAQAPAHALQPRGLAGHHGLWALAIAPQCHCTPLPCGSLHQHWIIDSIGFPQNVLFTGEKENKSTNKRAKRGCFDGRIVDKDTCIVAKI